MSPVKADHRVGVTTARAQNHLHAVEHAGHPLDELEARRPLELLQVAPGVPVGDAELGRRLPERSALVDQSKQLGATAAELRALAEHHPHSYLGVHGLEAHLASRGQHRNASRLTPRGYAKTREIGT